MPIPQRPVPEDFAAMLARMSFKQLAEHYVASPNTVSRWRKEIGQEPTGRGGFAGRPMPDDFRERAPVTSNDVLMKAYGVGGRVIWRWRRECGIPAPRPKSLRTKPYRPVPDGFAEVASQNPNRVLIAMFHASERTVARWRREAGAFYTPPVTGRRRTASKAPSGFLEKMGRPRGQIFYVPPRDTTIEGQAAEVLRAYAPTYRCDRRGRQECPDIAKGFWRYGNVVLTPDELLQRAAAKGWRSVA